MYSNNASLVLADNVADVTETAVETIVPFPYTTCTSCTRENLKSSYPYVRTLTWVVKLLSHHLHHCGRDIVPVPCIRGDGCCRWAFSTSWPCRSSTAGRRCFMKHCPLCGQWRTIATVGALWRWAGMPAPSEDRSPRSCRSGRRLSTMQGRQQRSTGGWHLTQ